MRHTFKCWIFAKSYNSRVVYELSDLDWRMGGNTFGRTFVSEHSVELDLPEISTITPGIIASLEAKKEEMRATAAAAIAEVDGQIQSLLAIEQEVPA